MTENEIIAFPERGHVVVEEQKRPEPGADEVLIETRRTLVSTGTELSLLQGTYQRGDFPYVGFGYSNVGEVIAVGEGADGTLLGERVATTGDHARYVVANVEECHVVPDGIRDEEATFFRLAAIAMNGVRRGRVDWGKTVAIFGLGLVGQLAVRFCRIAGAATAVGLDLAASRRAHLPDRNGVFALDPAAPGFRDSVTDETGGRLADVVIETTGNVDAIAGEFDLLRDQGRFVVLSCPRESGEFDLYRHCNLPGYEIVGAHVMTHPPRATPADPWTADRHTELFLRYLRQGRLEVASMITHREPYRKAPDVYEMLLEDRTRALGVVFEW